MTIRDKKFLLMLTMILVTAIGPASLSAVIGCTLLSIVAYAYIHAKN